MNYELYANVCMILCPITVSAGNHLANLGNISIISLIIHSLVGGPPIK